MLWIIWFHYYLRNMQQFWQWHLYKHLYWTVISFANFLHFQRYLQYPSLLLMTEIVNVCLLIPFQFSNNFYGCRWKGLPLLICHPCCWSEMQGKIIWIANIMEQKGAQWTSMRYYQKIRFFQNPWAWNKKKSEIITSDYVTK